LTEPFHLSFPFLFEYQRELYVCPQAGEQGSARFTAARNSAAMKLEK